ncbi:MAG: aminoacetone oxidase family FAD-binding enzyme, partial [Halanaerobiaceae bacterium]
MIDPVIIVGGGAAGMMAAGTAASRNKDVLLIEKNKKTGRKLLLTGKGRCNLTNASNIEGFFDNIVSNDKFLYSALYSFNNNQLRQFFHKLGVPTKVERGQRVFPVSERAADIVNALRNFLKKHRVKVITGKAVKIITDSHRKTENDIKNNSNNYTGNMKYLKKLLLSDNRQFKCSSLIIATGGLSYPGTGSSGDGYRLAEDVGHTVTKLKPALVPLEVENDWVQDTDYL